MCHIITNPTDDKKPCLKFKIVTTLYVLINIHVLSPIRTLSSQHVCINHLITTDKTVVTFEIPNILRLKLFSGCHVAHAKCKHIKRSWMSLEIKDLRSKEDEKDFSSVMFAQKYVFPFCVNNL